MRFQKNSQWLKNNLFWKLYGSCWFICGIYMSAPSTIWNWSHNNTWKYEAIYHFSFHGRYGPETQLALLWSCNKIIEDFGCWKYSCNFVFQNWLILNLLRTNYSITRTFSCTIWIDMDWFVLFQFNTPFHSLALNFGNKNFSIDSTLLSLMAEIAVLSANVATTFSLNVGKSLVYGI